MARITKLATGTVTLTTGTLSLIVISTAAAGAAAEKVRPLRLEISQKGTTTLQMIDGEMATRDTAVTVTATATTPKNIQPIGGAVSGLTGNTAPVGGTARSGTNCSVDSGGTFVDVWPFAFANLNGYLWVPTPEEMIVVPASTIFVVRFLTVPTTLTGWNISMILAED